MSSARSATAIVIASTLIVSACGTEPVPQRPWEIDLPENIRVIEYPAVPAEDRVGRRIQLVEDLVIGSEDDPNAQFTQVTAVATDEDGRIYVADGRDPRVQVFTSEGEFLTTLGRGGQGPGEFLSPTTLTVSGARVFVGDMSGKVSVWSVDELSLVAEVTPPGRLTTMIGPRPDGFVLASTMGFRETEGASPGTLATYLSVAPISPDGTVGKAFFEVDTNDEPMWVRGSRYAHFLISPHPREKVIGAPDGRVYYTLASEYQVTALGNDGSPSWALRTPVVPASMNARIRGQLLGFVQERLTDAVESEMNFPDVLPVIGRLRVDGQGRLHVFHFNEDWADPEADRPVDIYDAEGARVFSGYAPATDWTTGRGDYVYGSGLDPATQEHRVYRWRLELPR